MSKQKRIVGALGLALVLALGFALVYAVAVAWGGSCWEAYAGRQRGFNEHLVVSVDGTPLIQRTTYNEDYQNNKTDFRTLGGKEVASADKKTKGWLDAASLQIARYRNGMFPIAGTQRIGRFSDGNDPWYFVDDGARDGHGYFVGYSKQNRRRLGFIGRSGFRPDQPAVEDWFPMDGVKLASNTAFAGQGHFYWYYYYAPDNSTSGAFPEWIVQMISGTQLVQIDLSNRSVTTLMESPDVVAAAVLKARAPEKGPSYGGDEDTPAGHLRAYLAVRTADRVVLFDGLGKQHSTYVIPEEFRDRGFGIYEVGRDTALLTYSDGSGKSPDSNVEKLAWIDALGKISQRDEAELYAGHPRDEHQEAWKAAGVVPSPIALAFFAAVMLPLSDITEAGKPGGYFAHAAHQLAVFALPLLVVSLFSAVLAFLCWRRNRRFHQPASIVWLVFVFLAGLPGLVGYLFHRRWPVLEACPACKQSVPRDRDACAECGAEFPPPPLKGIEVFA